MYVYIYIRMYKVQKQKNLSTVMKVRSVEKFRPMVAPRSCRPTRGRHSQGNLVFQVWKCSVSFLDGAYMNVYRC